MRLSRAVPFEILTDICNLGEVALMNRGGDMHLFPLIDAQQRDNLREYTVCLQRMHEPVVNLARNPLDMNADVVRKLYDARVLLRVVYTATLTNHGNISDERGRAIGLCITKYFY